MESASLSRNSKSSRKSIADISEEVMNHIGLIQQKKINIKKQQTLNQKKLKKQRIQSSKEESLREILGFFTNQIDNKKFIKKHKNSLKDSIYQTEFLNPNEYFELKGTYDDYNIGDLAIVFPNPDDDKVINDEITYKEAERVYDKYITVLTDEVSKSQMKKERDSFLLSFLTLDDYIKPDKKQNIKKNNKKKQKQKIKAQDIQEQLPENLQSNHEKESLFEQEHKTEPNKQKQTTYGIYKQFLEQYNLAIIQEENEYKKELEAEKIRQEENSIESQNSQQQLQDQLSFNKEQSYQDQQVEQQIKITSIDPLKELLKVDLSDSKQFENIKKKKNQGGFLFKQYNEKGDDYDWICLNNPPKDFMTLVRSTILNKLCRNAFLHCRQFISASGQHIFVIIKSSKEVIIRQAQKMKITKQIDLGFADLFSLEPVDVQFRPLRLKNYVRVLDDKLKQQVDQQDDDVYKFDIKIGVEKFCKTQFIKVKQWSDEKLHVNVIRKQKEMDEIMKNISKQFNFDQSREKVELIDDCNITNEEWKIYYIYMECIVCCFKFIEIARQKGYSDVIENEAFLYKLIFLKALGDANDFWYADNYSYWKGLTNKNEILFNIWGRLKIQPIAPYTEFFKSQGEAGSSLWRKFQINENQLRSEFINMEKIKITNSIVLKHINMLKLLQQKLAVAYFPIHDYYQLSGKKKQDIIKEGDLGKDNSKKICLLTKLIDTGLITEKKQTESELFLKQMFEQMSNKAEATDFDSESLEQEAAFQYLTPWFIPVDSIRDYFGEKIALYFDFLNYYSKQLWYMAILGIIAQGIISSSNENARSTIIIGFSLIIIIWSTFFMEFWKREQVYFSVKFGQQNFEADEAERPAFEGDFIRSIVNDDLNEEFYSPFKRKMIQFLAFSVSFIIICCVVGCVIGINLLKNTMIESGTDSNTSSIVPSILQSISIQFFNFFYNFIGMAFNNFENHKILSTYENSLVVKLTSFRFVNNFIQFFITAYLSGYFSSLGLCKVDQNTSDCFQVLSNQMTTIFLTNLIASSAPKLLAPIVSAFIIKYFTKEDLTPVPHEFCEIDLQIQKQLILDPYSTNEELDGSLNDYMEMVIQFSYLSLFGLAFPACFILAFVQNIVKIQVDKIRFFKLSRRPFPQGAASIGNWLAIFEIVSFLAIFTNAGLIVFTSRIIKEKQVYTFTILLIVFLILKYLIRFLIPDEPFEATILNKRHRFVVEKAVKGFKQERNQHFHLQSVNRQIGGLVAQQQGHISNDGLIRVEV